ncbi:hypothetical protein ACFLYB_03505 [Chloroflexota bacterium]
MKLDELFQKYRSRLINWMKSVLHIGCIAGVPQTLAMAQRKEGLTSDVLAFGTNPFRYDADYSYPTTWHFPLNYVQKILILFKMAKQYEMFHFHYNSIAPFGLDFPFYKMSVKKIIMHHHGSDIRGKSEKFLYSKFAHQIFVSTPDLLEWSPNAVWIPNPIDLESFPYIGIKKKSSIINIVHAPTNRARKGTKHVIRAVENLKREGYKVHLSLIENIPHSEVIDYYKKADIVVDQLLIGWYGVLAVEAIALGKPVCVYIRDDLESYMPFMPFFNTSLNNITENLRNLIESEKLRTELGIRGREYVEQMHNSRDVARKVIQYY